MAGERSGRGTKTPQGIRGRLSAYVTGQGLGGGLIGVSLDQALADPVWLKQRVTDVEQGKPMRAKDWGKESLRQHNLQVRWLVSDDTKAARALEAKCLRLLADTGLWNHRA